MMNNEITSCKEAQKRMAELVKQIDEYPVQRSTSGLLSVDVLTDSVEYRALVAEFNLIALVYGDYKPEEV